jgi:HAAS
MTVTDHPAVGAYLARFDALAAHLPQYRREELRADLVEHLQDALPDGADDSSVHAVLQRLGPPEEIIEAASEGETAQQPAPVRALRRRARAATSRTAQGGCGRADAYSSISPVMKSAACRARARRSSRSSPVTVTCPTLRPGRTGLP